MRKEPNLKAEKWRFSPPGYYDSPGGVNWGAFVVEFRGVRLHVISSGTDEENGWEHVSISTRHRTPTWAEMQHVKELFWRDDECVLQFHPTKSDRINDHPSCLHLWRSLTQETVMPPRALVGAHLGNTPESDTATEGDGDELLLLPGSEKATQKD
jgi:hypothetical protein